MDDDFVSRFDVGDLLTYFPDDPRTVAPTGVKIFGLSFFLSFGDDV